MRLAILSDIHGNAIALEAVLNELKRTAPDQVVCLGDVAADGPEPRRVIDYLRTLNCPVVMGNMDEQLLHPPSLPANQANDDSSKFQVIWAWGAAQLSEADKLFLQAFQPTLLVEIAYNFSVLCYHGSPHSNRESIRATSPDDELDSYFEGQNAPIFVGGHTHRPFLRRYRDHWVMNPGSVGLAYEWNPHARRTINLPQAEFVLLTWQNGQLSIDFRTVPFDLEGFEQRVRDAGMPYEEWLLTQWHPS